MKIGEYRLGIPPGGGTLGISARGCAPGTLEPLAYTRATSDEFCCPIDPFHKWLPIINSFVIIKIRLTNLTD